MAKLALLVAGVLISAVSASAFASSTSTASPELKAFYTDGCTGFVDGPPGESKLWYHCCQEHDLRYWFGGTKGDMSFADKALRQCVDDAAGSTWASIIYNGVLAGHRSPIKAKTFWGWAWTPARGKDPLTKDEIEIVKAELRKLPLEPSYIEQFIAKYLPESAPVP